MKMLIGAALVAAIVAPQAVLAAEASDNMATAAAAARFEIVDAQSGRVVGTLVPVAGSPGTLRLIGVVHAPASQVARPTSAAPSLLGPYQLLEQQQREIEAQFHIVHSS